MQIKSKIGVKKITITRAEGRSDKCGIPKEYFSWADAHIGMLCAGDLPKNGGYDKHDLVVQFEDGETYSGRLDAKHPTCEDNDLHPRKHINNYLSFLAGLKKPAHLTDNQYQDYLAELSTETKNAAARMLTDYDL